MKMNEVQAILLNPEQLQSFFDRKQDFIDEKKDIRDEGVLTQISSR